MKGHTVNPFRNAVVTYDLLPDDLKPRFIDALLNDWCDLESNANPIEHRTGPSLDEAIGYVQEWHGQESLYPHLDRVWLQAMADAWDHLTPVLPPDDETTFDGEKVSCGKYLAVRSCEWPSYDVLPTGEYTAKLVFNVDDSTVEHTVHFHNHFIS